ncbi:MAG: peptidoglycan-binding protein [Deltaproteobacteria bacterium]|nr:peptidoglycan-binding protein [Deltaproteobacteria bacterium]
MGNETTTKKQQVKTDGVEDVKQTLAKMQRWEPIIQRAAQRFGIAPDDIRAIIGVESHARAEARAGGAKSASGLMQVTAGTWSDMQKKHADLAPFDFASHWMKPEVNIMFGTATLAAKRDAMKRFGIDTNGPSFAKLAVTAYNGGEGVVKLAYQHAVQAGSKNPEEDCLQLEHLSYAVDHTRDQIWQYYMPGHGGAGRNKSGTRAEAVKLKTQEIMKYPTRVAAYLAVERGGKPEQTTPTTPVKKTSSNAPTGRLVGDSVGQGGANRTADAGAVQAALARHGVDPGAIDERVGPKTIAAIRRFQKGLLRKPDGLVEVGKTTERHLLEGGGAPTPETKPTQEKETKKETKKEKEKPTTDGKTSPDGAAQMARLVAVARSVRGQRPAGRCYAAVKVHIKNAGGYGNLRNIYTDKRMQPQGEAHDFADIVNRDPPKFGLERLGITNPYDAPEGSLVVVSAGSPGTRHKTAGDITVKGPGDEFYNDGRMGYRGRAAWPPKTGRVLGVYKPR